MPALPGLHMMGVERHSANGRQVTERLGGGDTRGAGHVSANLDEIAALRA